MVKGILTSLWDWASTFKCYLPYKSNPAEPSWGSSSLSPTCREDITLGKLFSLSPSWEDKSSGHVRKSHWLPITFSRTFSSYSSWMFPCLICVKQRWQYSTSFDISGWESTWSSSSPDSLFVCFLWGVAPWPTEWCGPCWSGEGTLNWPFHWSIGEGSGVSALFQLHCGRISKFTHEYVTHSPE